MRNLIFLLFVCKSRVLYGNDTFGNKKDKISSHGKILSKVRRNAGNRNGCNCFLFKGIQMSSLSTTAFEIHLFQMPSLSTTTFELSKFRLWFRRTLAEVAKDNAFSPYVWIF